MAKLKALILAGGFGRRLRPFTNEVPKPMLSVAGRPLIEWQMQWLKKNGIDDLVLCVGYLREKIKRYVGDGSRFGMSVVYSTEDKMLGTGGAIKNAQRLLSSESGFYVVNGDILSTIDLAKLAGDTHAIAAVQMRNPFGVVSTIDDNKDVSYVKEFLQKPLMDDIWINAGIYYFQIGIFDYFP